MTRSKRFLTEKNCDRCGNLLKAEEFPKVRGGGTADVCNECKRKAVSAAMIVHHGKDLRAALKLQDDHFKKSLLREQARWDSLPDGHPYKSPKRPTSPDGTPIVDVEFEDLDAWNRHRTDPRPKN